MYIIIFCCRFSHVKSLPSNIVAISAGGMHTVLLDNNGKVCWNLSLLFPFPIILHSFLQVWTFGCNDEGALGRDTSVSSEVVPATVILPGRAIRISAGDSHSAALLESGQVFAWGSFRVKYERSDTLLIVLKIASLFMSSIIYRTLMVIWVSP